MLPLTENIEKQIIEEYTDYVKNKSFPCIAAKAAIEKQNIQYSIAGHMACPHDDKEILNFLYRFTDTYRKSKEFYHSAVVIFRAPEIMNEDLFDKLLWQRLQALVELDSAKYPYDNRVSSDPKSENFSFSIKEEAFYIIGLHPSNSRMARRFKYPALVFNPHAQFEALRESSKYEHIKNTVRKRDIALSGSVNPMLQDFGDASEVFQYSGKQYLSDWECPLNTNNAKPKHNSSA